MEKLKPANVLFVGVINVLNIQEILGNITRVFSSVEVCSSPFSNKRSLSSCEPCEASVFVCLSIHLLVYICFPSSPYVSSLYASITVFFTSPFMA